MDVQDKEKTLNAITSTLTSTLFDTDYRVLISTIFLKHIFKHSLKKIHEKKGQPMELHVQYEKEQELSSWHLFTDLQITAPSSPN